MNTNHFRSYWANGRLVSSTEREHEFRARSDERVFLEIYRTDGTGTDYVEFTLGLKTGCGGTAFLSYDDTQTIIYKHNIETSKAFTRSVETNITSVNAQKIHDTDPDPELSFKPLKTNSGTGLTITLGHPPSSGGYLTLTPAQYTDLIAFLDESPPRNPSAFPDKTTLVGPSGATTTVPTEDLRLKPWMHIADVS